MAYIPIFTGDCLDASAYKRPSVDPLWQDQPPPQVPEVVDEHAQLQLYLVRSEPVTRQPRPMYRLVAFLNPLLGRATPVGWAVRFEIITFCLELSCHRVFRSGTAPRWEIPRKLVW